MTAAQKVLDEVKLSNKPLPAPREHTSYLGEEAESMRWFLLPNEAQQLLSGQATPTVTPPFQPRRYPKEHHPESTRDDMSLNESKTLSLEKSSQLGNESLDNVSSNSDSSREQLLNKELSQDVKKTEEVVKFHSPPSKSIYKPTTEVQFGTVKNLYGVIILPK